MKIAGEGEPRAGFGAFGSAMGVITTRLTFTGTSGLSPGPRGTSLYISGITRAASGKKLFFLDIPWIMSRLDYYYADPQGPSTGLSRQAFSFGLFGQGPPNQRFDNCLPADVQFRRTRIEFTQHSFG